MSRPDILVVGSINYDILLFQSRLAMRGETLLARDVREDFGGKGANQAVQCAKLGQHVTFLGAVGRDQRGRISRRNLQDQGVECHIADVEPSTGMGVVNVLDNGEVHATILEGANASVDPAYVADHMDLFQSAGFVILQNEIPVEAVAMAIRCAGIAGAKVLYNAAPARPVSPEVTAQCEYFIVNEEEAMFYLEDRIDDLEAMKSSITKLKRYCPKVIVTLGSAGSLISFDSDVHHIPAVPVQAVDTTGAGDSYVGALASALNDGLSDLEAVRFATIVAAQATAAVGAQTSMPTSGDVSYDQVRTRTVDTRDS